MFDFKLSNFEVNLNLLTLLRLIVLISTLKNIVYWRYPLLNSGEFIHFPILPFLQFVPQMIFASLALLAIILSLSSFWFQSKRNLIVTLYVCGFSNILFQLSDYLGLHHDMYLSGIAFVFIALHLQTGRYLDVILAFAASTYLLSGIYKIHPDFLDGSITEDIILRSNRYFYGEIFSNLVHFSKILSIFAMLVELIEPIILIFGSVYVKRLSVLITLPFHLGIILTGTGTIYNMMYPFLFWLLAFNDTGQKIYTRSSGLVQSLNEIGGLIIMIIGIVYLLFLTSFVPNIVGIALGKLL